MKRKEDDKRVLFSPNSNRSRRSNKRKRPQFKPRSQSRKPRKWGNIIVFLIILALIAFVLGVGSGISLTFENDNGPQWENVTEEMTTNLSDVENFTYDSEVDNVDYNSNDTLTELNVTVEPSY